MTELRKPSRDLIQERNGEESNRSFDVDTYDLLKEILAELKQTNLHLSIITGEDNED